MLERSFHWRKGEKLKDKIITIIAYIIIGIFIIANIWVIISSIIYQFANPTLTETQLILHSIKTYWWVMIADVIGCIVINNK